jgi:ribosome biogenesis GTPase / thiamine phosphate phosphatase
VTLEQLGWNPFFQKQLAAAPKSTIPARVMEEQRGGTYRLHTGILELTATLSGAFRKAAESRSELPTAGDWVGVRGDAATSVIEHVFTRRSRFSRQAPGEAAEEQVIGANVDIVFVITSMNRDLNLPRLERYLTSVWMGGAMPVVLLNKSDLVEDTAMQDTAVADVAAIAPGVTVLAVSSIDGTGLAELAPFLSPGRTLALVGSSGVGKSTLTNRLLGRDEQAVAAIREDDDRGRHTTVTRRLIPLMVDGKPGALLLDTPGMRELQLWGSESSDIGMARAFPEIETLAGECRFRDCRHEGEPGCAVRQAIADERLDPRRMESFRKLEKELSFAAIKQDAALRSEQNKRWKKLHKAQKEFYRQDRKTF